MFYWNERDAPMKVGCSAEVSTARQSDIKETVFVNTGYTALRRHGVPKQGLLEHLINGEESKAPLNDNFIVTLWRLRLARQKKSTLSTLLLWAQR
jgi:hypothetical protein